MTEKSSFVRSIKRRNHRVRFSNVLRSVISYRTSAAAMPCNTGPWIFLFSMRSSPEASQTCNLTSSPLTVVCFVNISGPAVGMYSGSKSSPPPKCCARQLLPTRDSPNITIFAALAAPTGLLFVGALFVTGDGDVADEGTGGDDATGTLGLACICADELSGKLLLNSSAVIASKTMVILLHKCEDVTTCFIPQESQRFLTFSVTPGATRRSDLQPTTT